MIAEISVSVRVLRFVTYLGIVFSYNTKIGIPPPTYQECGWLHKRNIRVKDPNYFN